VFLTAKHLNTLKNAAKHHAASHGNTLQHTATQADFFSVLYCSDVPLAATLYNMLQHAATRYNALQRTATHCNTG